MNIELFWNQQIGFPILTLLVFLPLVGALSIWLRRDLRNARLEAMVISLIELGLSVLLFFQFETDLPAMQFVEQLSWIPALGISYHLGVDGISLFLVILTTFLTFLMMVYSWDRIRDHVQLYLGCLLVMEATMIGAYVSLDLILFFVFWEVMLIPMYFMIKVWGTGPERDAAALKYIVYNLIGGVLMLVGFIILYLNYHQWAMEELGRNLYSFDYMQMLLAPVPFREQLWVFGLIFMAFAFKGPIIPFHTWLPSAMLRGPVAVGVMLSGVKLGSYGLLRFNLPLTPAASEYLVPLMMVLGLVGLLYGAFIALSQSNLMVMMSYAGISHLGFVTIGLFSLNRTGIEGALLQMVNLGIAGAGMMFILAFLMDRRGSLNLKDYGGVAKQMPLLASLSLVIVLASLALPGTNVFVGEFLILVGVFKVNWIYAAIAVTAVILAASYLLWMYERVFLGRIEKQALVAMPDLNRRESFIAITFVVLILGLGFYPAPLLDRMKPSIQMVVNRLETKMPATRTVIRLDLNNPHGYLNEVSLSGTGEAGRP